MHVHAENYYIYLYIIKYILTCERRQENSLDMHVKTSRRSCNIDVVFITNFPVSLVEM